jgi:hypothetical protein
MVHGLGARLPTMESSTPSSSEVLWTGSRRREPGQSDADRMEPTKSMECLRREGVFRMRWRRDPVLQRLLGPRVLVRSAANRARHSSAGDLQLLHEQRENPMHDLRRIGSHAVSLIRLSHRSHDRDVVRHLSGVRGRR